MKKVKNPDPVQSDPVLEAQMKEHMENLPQSAKVSEEQNALALITQPSDLPVLGTVKGRDGKIKLTARIKGKFTSISNTGVLTTQKIARKVMCKPDEQGTSQLERIITKQAEVCENNTDARNLGGISKFLEHVDVISGQQAAREALTKEVNTNTVPKTIIILANNLMHPELVDGDKRKEKPKQPSFAASEVISTNPPTS